MKRLSFPKSAKLRWLLWSTLALLIVTAIQLCIPTGTTSYYAKLDGKSVSLRNKSALETQIKAVNAAAILNLGTKSVPLKLEEAGIALDASKTLDPLSSVTSTGKMIPFMAVFQLVKPTESHTVRSVNKDQLTGYASIIAKQYSYEPSDATASVTDTGAMVITKQKTGMKFTSDGIIKSLMQYSSLADRKAIVRGTVIQPAISADVYGHVQEDFDALKDKSLTVIYGDKTQVLTAKEFLPLLEVVKNDTNFSLQLKQSALQQYSYNWGKDFNIAPGISQVTYTDGVETYRKDGASGLAIDVDAVSTQIQSWVTNPTVEPITLATKAVPPKVIVTRLSSATSAVLQQNLNDWVRQHGGGYQVAIQELGGAGRIASYNVAQRTTMASTYKLFVAFAAYTQAENGSLSLNTPVYNGLTIEQCISKAIINSDNDCAIAVARYIGWAKIDQIDAAAGFTNVFVNNYDANGNLSGDKLVNAAELAKFLVQLSQGSLISRQHSDNLLSYMKQQVYRSGIPAGSHGSVVADKVGFLDDFTHDAGIVYSPKATYALVIMSNGGNNWSNIRDLASAVYSFMNQ